MNAISASRTDCCIGSLVAPSNVKFVLRPLAGTQSCCHAHPRLHKRWRTRMNVWEALQYVGTGLSLVAFAVAAILLAYRARLAHRAEIIKSAPEKERLEAIAITAEFFRVDVSGLTRAQQQEIALTQIHARARRDLLLAGLSLAVAIFLAAIAIVAVLCTHIVLAA